MYIKGYSALKLNLIDDAITALKTLVEVAPDNAEFKNLFLEAKNTAEQNLKKEKSIYKKMLFKNWFKNF